MVSIYDKANIKIGDYIVSDESYRYRAIMGDNKLYLTIQLVVYVEFPIGANCTFQGEVYTLNTPPTVTKKNTRDFEILLVMDGAISTLEKYKFRDSNTGRLKFFNTAKPQEHLAMLVWNLNARDGAGVWSYGTDFIVSLEKLVTFNHTSCIDALKAFADAFNTEYEVIGNVIHLRKVEKFKTEPLSLSYGKGHGFKTGVKRVNFNQKTAVDRLYIQGGSKNIDASSYGKVPVFPATIPPTYTNGCSELRLPRNTTVVRDGVSYVTDVNGFSVSRVGAASNGVEDSLDLSNVYPQKVGTITDVYEATPLGKNFYNFVDLDNATDFEAYRIGGTKMTVIFQSGNLEGREFEINKYTHATKTFEVVPMDVDGIPMPATNYLMNDGDKYAVFGISLPSEYITAAETEMLTKAVDYLIENETPKFSFTGEMDGIWAKQNWNTIYGTAALKDRILLGSYVLFTDAQFQTLGVKIRMTGVRDYVNNPHTPQIELSNVTVTNSVSSTIKKLEKTEVIIEKTADEISSYAKRGFADAQATSELIQASMLEGFTKGITPITVQTMQLLVGAENLQFRFVNQKTTGQEKVNSGISWSNNDHILRLSSAKIIQHLSIGLTGKVSAPPLASDYKYWDIQPFDSAPLAGLSGGRYLYAVVSRTTQIGSLILEESAQAFDSMADWYILLVGILTSENEQGERSYSELFGFTEVIGGRVTTDAIVSQDGTTFFNLGTGEIGGNIKFLKGGVNVPVGEGIDNAIGGIKQATVNYLNNSRTDSVNGWGADGGTITLVTDTNLGKVIQYERPAGGGNFMKVFTLDASPLVNTDLVYYCIAKKTSTNGTFNFGGWQVTFNTLNETSNKKDIGNGWYLYWVTFAAGATIHEAVENYTFGLNSVSGTWRFHSFGVCKGNTPPTDWMASPNDIPTATKYLTEAMQGNTEVIGGLLATHLLMLKSSANGNPIMGGMSGLLDNVAFWSGGTYNQANLDAAKAWNAADMGVMSLDRKDGKGHRAKGAFAWDENGNALFKGIIQALNGGKIGNFDIIGGAIVGKVGDDIRLKFGTGLIDSLSAIDATRQFENWVTLYPAGGGGSITGASKTVNGDIKTVILTEKTIVKFNNFYANLTATQPYVEGASLGGISLIIQVVKGGVTTSYTPNQEVEFEAGTYTVQVIATITANNNNGTTIGYETNYGLNPNLMKEVGMGLTEIGSNGLFSYWNSRNYLYYSPEHGLEVRVGSHKLVLNSTKGEFQTV